MQDCWGLVGIVHPLEAQFHTYAHTLPLQSCMQGRVPNFEDLRTLDPELHRSLLMVRLIWLPSWVPVC